MQLGFCARPVQLARAESTQRDVVAAAQRGLQRDLGAHGARADDQPHASIHPCG